MLFKFEFNLARLGILGSLLICEAFAGTHYGQNEQIKNIIENCKRYNSATTFYHWTTQERAEELRTASKEGQFIRKFNIQADFDTTVDGRPLTFGGGLYVADSLYGSSGYGTTAVEIVIPKGACLIDTVHDPKIRNLLVNFAVKNAGIDRTTKSAQKDEDLQRAIKLNEKGTFSNQEQEELEKNPRAEEFYYSIKGKVAELEENLIFAKYHKGEMIQKFPIVFQVTDGELTHPTTQQRRPFSWLVIKNAEGVKILEPGTTRPLDSKVLVSDRALIEQVSLPYYEMMIEKSGKTPNSSCPPINRFVIPQKKIESTQSDVQEMVRKVLPAFSSQGNQKSTKDNSFAGSSVKAVRGLKKVGSPSKIKKSTQLPSLRR
jgi:hypothetical protein